MGGVPLLAGPDEIKVPPRVTQAEPPVGSAPDGVGVVLVLTVVLPEAHGTDLERTSLAEREVSAAGTSEGPVIVARGHRAVLKPLDVPLEPPNPVLRCWVPGCSAVHSTILPTS